MSVSLASAPGKVVLFGEYAVLDGAPAIAMAVDRRARVRVASDGRDLPGVDSALVDAVIDGMGASSALSCECDTSEFLDAASATKFGLGSSAALTVALCAAIKGDADVLDDAARIHRAWQGGVGSGVDIACAVSGGLVEYRAQGQRVVPLQWPAGLAFRLLWTGTASDTRDRLSHLRTQRTMPSRQRLADAAAAVAAECRNGDAGALLEGVPQYVERLREFSVDHDLGVFDAGHDELVDIASANQIVYKPCGAGGGDVGIALATEPPRLDAFVAEHKLHVIDCAPDPIGVALEES